MKHVDLFSGIGGFSYACDIAGIETILFCEMDKFCQKVLNKHWPEVPCVEDVNNVEEITRIIENSVSQRTGRELVAVANKGRTTGENRREGIRQGNRTIGTSGVGSADKLLLTAGFPCQPFSNAGRKRGSADGRYLWPQTLAVIEAIRPEHVILENVSGLLSMVFPDSEVGVASQATLFGVENDEICDYSTISGRIDSDLRQAGYETVWLVIPACGVGAPHRRDRVWIVANLSTNSNCSKPTGKRGTIRETEGIQGIDRTALCSGGISRTPGFSSEGIVANAESQQEHSTGTGGLHAVPCSSDSHATDTSEQGLQGKQPEQSLRLPGQRDREWGNEKPNWSENWYEVATKLCTLDDGLPNGLVRPKGWRVNALKAAGNAIVPAVAYQIIKSVQREVG